MPGRTPELQLHRYCVRQWTAFRWPDDRQGVEESLERAAGLMQRALVDKCPKYDPRVKAVRIDGQPQLLFELTVPGEDENDAGRRATYRFERALTAARSQIRLRPPWGKREIEVVLATDAAAR